MEFTLYQFSKRRNSTKIPTTEQSRKLQGWLKEAESMYYPTFTIKEFLPTYTYLQWEGRYYFINDFSMLRNDFYALSCELDVLATYKQNILQTSAYVQYSSSNYDANLIDTRLSSNSMLTIDTSEATLFTDASGIPSGTFILTYVTSEPHYSTAGIVLIKESQAISLAHSLASQGFIDWLTNTQKQLTGAYDSLISCVCVPFDWTTGTIVQYEIVLAGYHSGIQGYNAPTSHSYSCDVRIPWKYTDFRNLDPYTSLMLYLPAYGYYPLNPSDFYGYNTIPIKCVVDGLTGQATYIINNTHRADTSFGVNVSIGTLRTHGTEVATNLFSGLGSLLGAVASPPTSLAAATALGLNLGSHVINGAIASNKRDVGSTGSNGGTNSIFSTPASAWYKVQCIIMSHNTNVEPSTFAPTNGRPCNKILTLSSLSGYCQTINASVSAPTADISNKINSLLNGGIFIE